MKQRNYGIDLLRIISMFMVVVLHVLGRGGVLGRVEPGSANYWLAWTLEIAAYCAVNCFALISGFVMWQSNFKASKLLAFWLQVVFYTVTITAIFAIIEPGSIGLRRIISAVMPISMAQYWYLSAYFFMYLLVPVLNMAIQKLPRKTLRNILLGIFGLVSVLTVSLATDPYGMKNGYSAIWLMVLYLAGGYFAKYEIYKKFPGWKNLLAFVAAVGVTVLSKLVLAKINYAGGDEILINYLSPTIVICAVALLFWTANLKIGRAAEKVIKVLAPAALGVYIIHVNPLIWGKVAGVVGYFAEKSPLAMLGWVILTAAGVYLACSIVEIWRIYLFKLVGRVARRGSGPAHP